MDVVGVSGCYFRVVYVIVFVVALLRVSVRMWLVVVGDFYSRAVVVAGVVSCRCCCFVFA